MKVLEKQIEECPDCGHERKYHMNLVGCCYPIGKSPSSKIFEGGIEYCYCQRLEGFINNNGKKKRKKILKSPLFYSFNLKLSQNN